MTDLSERRKTLNAQMRAVMDAQFMAKMSDNYYYVSGRKAEHDKRIRELQRELDELEGA